MLATALMGSQCQKGLSSAAQQELADAGVNKYIGDFTPVASSDVGDGWTKHTFDTDGGNGPICIAGTPFSAFTRAGDPEKLLIFEQGGGACWQDFYFCNVLAEDQEPPTAPVGIWDFDSPDNPFADYSIVYMPYCDGSVFAGDNDVVDANFPFGPVRFHRGLRNQTAGMDLAAATFPNAKKIVVSGTSAGGVGASGFAPFLVRFLYGNGVKLSVVNDAGPVTVNPLDVTGIAARAADWQFDQFYPASCTACGPDETATAIIDWRLENDTTITEAWYETDGDETNRFFLMVPTQEEYRDLILADTDAVRANHPLRYKRFIKSGDSSHTALQTPLFNTQTVNGIRLDWWTSLFLHLPVLTPDLVEDFVPLP
ncbi:MAG: pectin acetylesterase-family hydrolase [Myxococcota bacterium]